MGVCVLKSYQRVGVGNGPGGGARLILGKRVEFGGVRRGSGLNLIPTSSARMDAIVPKTELNHTNVPIDELKDVHRPWEAVIMVEQKTRPYQKPGSSTRMQKMIFSDDKGARVEGIMFNNAIDLVGHKFEPCKKYRICNATTVRNHELPPQARSRVTVNLIEQSGSIQATAFGEIGERLLGMSSIELYEHPHQVDLHARNAVLEHQTYTFKLSGKGYYKGLRNFSDVNLIDDNQHSEAPLLLPAPPTAPTDKTDATALPNVDPPIEKTDVCPIDKTDSTTLPNVDPPIDKTDMCDHSDASNDSDGPLLKKKKPAKSPKKTSN
ncbi:OLC1v1012833C1 [Oldenlandia corymbosa var. corymbosa]|uniref:OLC1v1012833C1 n=1 Tax=Oldenlandia corymbosa var. corymbosa TaxID=529605 RepID=A0AAV1DWS2_OLDCO|nr:OLC1v1012833C1 [Oldenlandia corymbosa var. corymbosa]